MKTIYLACFTMLWRSFAFAQTDTSTLLGSIQYSFALLDSTKISTHILLDRTLPFGHPEYYTGQSDSICSIKRYKQIYWDMRNASYQSQLQLPDLSELEDRASAYLNNNIHPISLSRFNYNIIRPESLDSGWLSFDTVNRQFKNAPDSDGNPYTQKNLFAAAVFNPVSWQGQTKFQFAHDLFFSNTNFIIQDIKIDFDDGYGYRSIHPDEIITINYTGFEEGSLRTIKIRVVNHSGDIWYAKTQFRLAKTGQDITPDGTIEVQENFRNAFNTCQITNGFEPGDARFYIQYANYFEGKLKKPIIIVEGFDIDNNANDERYGDLGWKTFKTGLTYNEDGDQTTFQLQNLPVLMTRLKTEGYDVIIVDFKDGGKRIESNALALISIIQWVNLKKESTNELCVMGASMGGLIVRYALRLMEQKGCNHCTRLYTTFDSPHRGANIPLGVQHFVKFFAQVDADAKAKYDRKLSSEAAMQMLVYHVNPLAATYRDSWQNQLNQMGHPQKPFRVSLINGASNGTGLGFTAGSQIIQYHANWWVIELMGNAWALPNSPNGPSGQLVFTGKAPKNGGWTALLNFTLNPFLSLFGIHFNHFETSEGLGFATLPYDNAPGGKTETFKDIADTDFPIGDAESLVGDDHCFIPSVSAMDINTNNLNLDLKFLVESNPSMNPFHSYYFPDQEDNKFNQKHVEVTTGVKGNIEWIIQQLKLNEPIPNIASLPNSKGARFNYAIPTKRFIKGDIVINAGGELVFNKNVKMNYGSNIDPMAVPSSTQYFQSAECDLPTITVNTGGQFSVGDVGPTPINNKGIVTFNQGSSLVLNSGSLFIIHKGSKVIIEAGASLYINQGAIIQIAETGILEIKGKLFLGNNAVLTINELPGEGKGFLKFVSNEFINGISFQINPGINSKIRLVGSSSGTNLIKVLEIAGTGGLHLQQHVNPYNFEVINGTIELGANNFIKSTTHINLQNTIIKPSGNGNPLGIILDEDNFATTPVAPNITIDGCKFYYCNTGLSIIRTSTSPSFSLSNNSFYNCSSGLYTNGISMTLSKTSFVSCEKGWEIGYPVGTMTGSELITSNCGTGIYQALSNPSVLSLTKHHSVNDDIGVSTSSGTLKVKCMYAYNNTSAAIFSENTTVILNGSDAGYNQFLNSQEIGLQLHNQSILNIKDGNNYFSKSTSSSLYDAISEGGHTRANLNCAQGVFSPDPSGQHMEAMDISGNYFSIAPSLGYKRLCGTVYQNGAFYNNNLLSSTFIATQIDNTCNLANNQPGGYSKKEQNDGNETSEKSFSTPLLNTEQITIYPNPAEQELIVDLSNLEDKKICLYDEFGRLVYAEVPINSVTKINTSQYKVGIYILHIVGAKVDKRTKITITH